jgi:hypothetical protein
MGADDDNMIGTIPQGVLAPADGNDQPNVPLGASPAQQAAVTSQSQGSIASAFDSLQQSAANRVAATGNSAGFSELTDDLVRTVF